MQTASAAGDVVAERYRLVARLGSGGMGTVWRAHDELLERTVALKEVVIPTGLPAEEVTRLRRRYLREARAAARLQHENVVVVHDVISEANTVWIVMELLECPDLAAILKADGPLTPAEAARVGLHVLDALVAAHAAGVLHRDVKPANVLITGSGRAVLTDFGVASVAGDASLTATGQLIGSPAYFAPERLTGDEAGPPSDLWSLGCTLYAAVEGRSPFARDEPFQILSAITVEALTAPVNAGRLAPVLYNLLEKDPTQRWDAERTRAALERVAAGMEVTVAPAWGAPGSVPNDTTAVRPAIAARAAAVRAAQPAPQRPHTTVTSAAGATKGPAAPRRKRSHVRVMLALVLLAALIGAAVAVAYPPLRERVLGASPGDQATPSSASEPHAAEYTNPTLGYTVESPSGWVMTCDDARSCRFAPPDARLINIFIEVKDAAGSSSLALTRAYAKRLAADPKDYPDYQELELAPKRRGSYRGTVHEFTFTSPQNGARHVRVFRTVFRNRSYELSLNAPAERFEDHQATYERLVSSLALPE